MKITKTNDLRNALAIAFGGDVDVVEIVSVNDAYVCFMLSDNNERTGKTPRYFVKYHIEAEYFCDVINLFMAGVNPLNLVKFEMATKLAREYLHDGTKQ